MEPPMLNFEVTVTSVARLSPAFVRVTFGGESLRRFHRCGELGPRDLRIKLVLNEDGSGPAPLVPDYSRTDWYSQWRAMDVADRGVMRTYTVRRVHGSVDRPLVDIDFVVHPGGTASTWAERATVGDRMLLVGPNAASQWYGGIEWRPPTTPGTRVLLVGDETAVPAIGSILQTLPSQYVGDAVIEVATAQDFLTLPTKADLEVCFLARDGRPRGELLLAELHRAVEVRAQQARKPPETLEDVDVDTDLLWEVPERAESAFYAWVAGEAAVVRSVRRYLVNDRGVDRRAVAFMGYWREGKPEAS